MAETDRYVVVSADCHGGAELYQYRDYLERRYHGAFDAWARDYAIPFEDLMGEEGGRNWDDHRRLADLEADGIVAEVVYPNTIPPFYPEPSLKVQMPGASEGDLDLRWAGLRAHNRWLADFCEAAPGRRAGIAQIMLHDIDAAVAEVEWAGASGLRGGILLPGAPPGSGLEPLYSPVYEPIWRACDEAGLVVNHHSGSAVPPLGDQPIDQVTFMLEVTWYAHRALWNLIFGGVMERHPGLQFVFTEQGTAWIPETLGTLDFFFHRMGTAVGSQEHEWGSPVVGQLGLRPSEYWARQCHVGSSFMRPAEAALRDAVGVDRIMWG
ncbi:MAG TPA: amidohydrolase family protein, partial [Acidimicrobiales bacterium]|nr:amidohydrolase family protein [Acidimicrobiales bacterium]